MSDRAQAELILEDLRSQEPLRALSELARWHESVVAAAELGEEHRIELLFTIDAAAQPVLAGITRGFVAAKPLAPEAQYRSASACHDYWYRAAGALERMLDRFERGDAATRGLERRLPALLVRTLHCLAQRIKWTYLRYGPADLAAWAGLNRAYAFAEKRGLAGTRAPVPTPGNAESTPRREFLACAMLGAISPESLLPREIELAAQLIAEQAERFVVSSSPRPRLPYWTDLAQAMVPKRLVQPPPTVPGLRFFGSGEALQVLSEQARRADAGGGPTGPASRVLAGLGNVDAALPVLRHLALHWAGEPPQRRSPRHPVRAHVSVAHGLAGVLEVLGAGRAPGGGQRTDESWEVENVSAGGFGAIVPQRARSDWLRVGTLLAVQPEGASGWIVGLVRRAGEAASGQLRVGIEILSKTPALMRLRWAGRDVLGVLLQGGPGFGGDVRLILPHGVWASGEGLKAELSGELRRYAPQGLDRSGDDYEIGNFRETPTGD